jgi:hypothetical protein
MGVLPGEEKLVRAMPPGAFPGKYFELSFYLVIRTNYVRL